MKILKLSPTFQLLPIFTFSLLLSALCSGTHPRSKPVAIFYVYRALITDDPRYDEAFHEFSSQAANFVENYNKTVQEKRDVYGCVLKLAKSVYGPYCHGPPGNSFRDLQPLGFRELVNKVTEDETNVRTGVAYGQFDNVVKNEYYRNIEQQLRNSQPEVLESVDNVIPVFVVLTGYMLDAALAEAAAEQADFVRSKGGHVFLVHIIFSELNDWKREQLETARKEFERIADGYYELVATDPSSVSEQITAMFARMRKRLLESIGGKTPFTGMIDVHEGMPSLKNENQDGLKPNLQNPEKPQIDAVVPQGQGQPAIVSQPNAAQPPEQPNQPGSTPEAGRQASKQDDSRKDHQNIAININIKSGESQKQSETQQKPSELQPASPQSPLLTAQTPPPPATTTTSVQSTEPKHDIQQFSFPQRTPAQPTPVTPQAKQQSTSQKPTSKHEILPQPPLIKPESKKSETNDENEHNVYINLARPEAIANIANTSGMRDQLPHFYINTTDIDRSIPNDRDEDESIHWVVIAMAVLTIIILFIAVVNLGMVKRGDTKQLKQPLPLPETPPVGTPDGNRRY